MAANVSDNVIFNALYISISKTRRADNGKPSQVSTSHKEHTLKKNHILFLWNVSWSLIHFSGIGIILLSKNWTK